MSAQSIFPEAVYREQEVPDYRGNRWIEALPPILEAQEASQKMLRLVSVDPAARAAPAHIRLHMLEGIGSSFLQPLDRHVSLFSDISVLLRRGYVHRNPLRPEFIRTLTEGANLVAVEGGLPPNQNLGPGFGRAFMGMSGVGKTTAVEAVLKCYDQAIWHPRLHGALKQVHQIVWLKLSCPHDGTPGGLCRMFFEAVDQLLGTRYTGLYCKSGATVEGLRAGMARVAFLHGLGILVVDEIQNLNAARSGGAELMMNFFKLLRDVMKVPVLLVGTEAAMNVLGGGFQVARRHDGMPQFEPMKNDEQFRFFLESLFEAQYLRQPVEVTDALCDLLFDLSQGITDLVVQLFVRAQARALACGIEQLSEELFSEVYRDSFGLLHPFLEMMRRGMNVPDGKWDRTMLESKLAASTRPAVHNPAPPKLADTGRRLLPAPRSVAPSTTPAAKTVVGVRKKRLSRAKPGQSSCLLVQAVEQGEAKRLGAHESLLTAGFIRSLGAEVLAA